MGYGDWCGDMQTLAWGIATGDVDMEPSPSHGVW